MQSLWWYSGEYINKSISGDTENKEYLGIIQAFAANNEAALRKRTEEIINQIVGDRSDQYLDYDRDGRIEKSGDGYGSLPGGTDRLGYLQETALYVKNAGEAPDSTPNIRLYSDNVQICLKNMEDWTNEILRLALQLNETPLGPDMKPIIDELTAAGDNLVHGVDADQNGFIDTAAGECGGDTVYEDVYYMADMQIYMGPDKIPPSGK